VYVAGMYITLYYISSTAVIYTGQIYLGAFTPAAVNVLKCQQVILG